MCRDILSKFNCTVHVCTYVKAVCIYIKVLVTYYLAVLLYFIKSLFFLDVQVKVEENNKVKNLTVKLADIKSYKDIAICEVSTLFRATVISF